MLLLFQEFLIPVAEWVFIPHLYFWASHEGMVLMRLVLTSEGVSGSGVNRVGFPHVVRAALRYRCGQNILGRAVSWSAWCMMN